MEGQPPAGKGKGRGRGRSKPIQQPQPVASASSSTPSTSSQQLSVGVGRGKLRAGGPSVSASTPPVQQLGALSIGGGGSGNGSNGGNGDQKPVGRYEIRGGRSLYEQGLLLESRPECAKGSKKGVSGQKTKFQANFFQLMKKPQWTLSKYHVDFNPPEDHTSRRKSLLRQHRESLGMYLFDGSTIFSSHNLCRNRESVEYFSNGSSDNERIRITIKFVGTVEISDYQNTQVMNIIFRECLSKLNLQLIKRNYFDKEARVMIREHNLELWPGYITAMGQYEYDILLQAEIIYKTLRRDTAYDILKELTRSSGGRQNYKDMFRSVIIGTTVMTTYNDKTYKIDDVVYNVTPESTFRQGTRDGERDISYMNYYLERYQVRIRDPAQPMLISKTNARERRSGLPDLLYLIPELCMMTGLNDSMRSNYPLMKAVAEHTSVAPSDRIRRLETFRNRLMDHPDVRTKLNNWGLSLAPKLIEVEGRILPKEDIVVHARSFSSGENVDWTRELRSSPFVVPAKFSQWVIIYPSKLKQEAQELARNIGTCGRGMSFEISNPTPVSISNDNASAYIQAIEDSVNRYHPQLFVIIVPNNRSDRYAAIKKKTIVDKPVPSQVVLQRNITSKSAMSIATKITIQINCKLGGVPWCINNPIKKGMVVGFDVCHDTREKCRSYGALVASIDETLGRYYSTINLHASGDELSSSISVNMKKAVNRYMQINGGRLPDPIILYRDGVGEGDLVNVFEVEVASIQKDLNEIYKAKRTELRLAVIIVTKRLNTRIFHNGRNPPPGSIVDDVITHPRRFDFFVVSQSVRQGTVSPTHYNVIHDTINWPVDRYQLMTYKLTHNYYNWSGTVRVPAPCQYAHKLAFLTSQSIGCAHSNLDQLLYFL